MKQCIWLFLVLLCYPDYLARQTGYNHIIQPLSGCDHSTQLQDGSCECFRLEDWFSLTGRMVKIGSH